jgi:putative polyhydroxyalkanoate system protein
MATIDIKRAHTLGIDTAKERAAQLADDLKAKMGITWRWDGDNIRFTAESGVAKGVTGTVSVTPAQVRVEIDLPFLMRALKGSIAEKVESKLDKLTAATS